MGRDRGIDLWGAGQKRGMTNRTSDTFRAFLLLWAAAMVAHFIYVQSVTDWGAGDVTWSVTNPWHPFYFGVLNATFSIVPFVLFQLPIAQRFGGWSSSVGRALIAYGTGTALWGLGNLYWFIQNVRGVDAPYPSLADAGYLCILPFAGWALWELSRVVGLRGADWKWLPVALLVAFPVNAYIMLPQGIGAGTFDTPLSTVISTTYIVSDVVLLAVAILVAIGARRAAGGRFYAATLAITGSLLILYVGDVIFNYRIAKDTFYNADVSDFLYGFFVLGGSIAAWMFLRADERATAAAAAAEHEWVASRASTDSDAEDDHLAQLAPLDQIATAIVAGQVRVMGAQAAYGVMREVNGVEQDGEHIRAVDTIAIDALIRAYRSISGPLGEMACWTAARPVLQRHPDVRPTLLERFRTDASSTNSTATRRSAVAN